MNCSRVVPRCAGVLLALGILMVAQPALAQQPSFGDDTSDFAKDGECDDPRFEGDGSAHTLLDDDRSHDATDCRTLFNQGRIRLRAGATSSAVSTSSRRGQSGVEFGDDSGRWANDSECDDPRFEGQGSASTLLDEDRSHDATDCRTLFNQGRIALRVASDNRIDFGDDSSEWVKDGECDDPRFEGDGSASTLVDADLYHDATDCRTLLNQGRIHARAGGADAAPRTGESTTTSTANGGRIERGHLQDGDSTLNSGEFADAYQFEGTRGNRAVVDLRSGEFDPYLLVRAPSGKQFDNDDHEGDSTRSQLALDLEENGTYKITVTSYTEGETGGYTVAIDLGAGQTTAARMDRNGSLQAGDETLNSGEFVDAYEFEGWPGQRVSIDLKSGAFDTYLILKDPRGEQVENDDADDGGTGHSSIESDLTETGTFRVLVTSYETGETGNYHLTITPAAALPDAPSRDVTTLTVGRPSNGQLEDGDQRLDTGEYRDIFVFDGNEGQTVRVELASPEFDTYVSLITPSDERIDNDDFEGASDRSVVEMTLPATGRYRVLATSYGADETGAYKLTLTTSARQLEATRRSGGRIFGVFAGISDYPGEENDLSYTAADATRIRDALLHGTSMSPDDAYTFVDADANRGNISTAIHEIAREAGPEDTFVLFYSGHGNRVPRRGGFDGTDPDGLDETIELYDGSMSDDEVRGLFDELHTRTTLILLDSCFSGGFAKDVISAPGRMGIFSSEEDVTSQVAAKFRAGGYLSAFLDDGIAEGLADEDKNGEVTALELSQYVHERYRSDVKGPAEYVRTGGPQSGYQHLVIDRGSIGPFDVLFER